MTRSLQACGSAYAGMDISTKTMTTTMLPACVITEKYQRWQVLYALRQRHHK
jgi:hypothetical protein